jgi:hypothetical protein
MTTKIKGVCQHSCQQVAQKKKSQILVPNELME